LDIPQLIDHTILRPDTTTRGHRATLPRGRQHKFYSVCVNPTWVSLAKQLLDGSGVKVCCVVGFPLGAQPPESKAMEARAAIRHGAKEIDMVINVGALKSNDDTLVLRDIRTVVEACRDGSAKCKVILETSLLTQQEKAAPAKWPQSPGRLCQNLDGFSTGGATVEDVALMARIVRDKGLGVKAPAASVRWPICAAWCRPAPPASAPAAASKSCRRPPARPSAGAEQNISHERQRYGRLTLIHFSG